MPVTRKTPLPIPPALVDPERPHLHRSIGLVGLTFVAVGGIIGSGWLFAPLLTTRLAGPAAIISWAIGGIAMLLLALCFAEVVGLLPVAGGIARIPHLTHGDVTSALLGWSAWVGYNTAAPIETIAMLQYLAQYWPWLFEGEASLALITREGALVAIGILFLFVTINALGAAAFARANSTITWIKLIIPIVVGVAIIAARFEPANFTAGDGFMPHGVEGIFGAVSSGGIIFALIGFRHAIDMAGEVKNPRVVVPLSLTISILICVGVYGLLQLAFVGAVDPALVEEGWSGLTFEHDLGPIAGIAAALGIGWISVTLAGGAILSPFGGGLIATGSMARLVYALAQNRAFPAFFEGLSKRGVPLRALLLNFVFGALVVAFVPFSEAVALNGAAITLSFTAGPLAVYTLRTQYPDGPRRFRMPLVHVVAPFAFLVATLVIYWSGWHTTWRLLLVVLVGLVLFAFRMWREGASLKVLDIKQATWLIPYLVGITLISYFGDYGGGRGLLYWPYGLAAAVALTLFVFWLGYKVRLSNEAAAVYRQRYATELPPDTVPL